MLFVTRVTDACGLNLNNSFSKTTLTTMLNHAMQEALFFDLGLVEYQRVYSLQKRLVELVAKGRFQQTLLLLEHFPVYTVGLSGSEKPLEGVQALKVDRGGDVTYHGPGQLVGYPIFRLKSRRVSRYIRKLEESLVILLKKYSIEGVIKEGYPGVWVGKEKIASIGVRIKDNVSYHGFALNVTVDLNAFQYIRPCGIDVTMTSMQNLLSREISMPQMKRNYVKVFEKCFDMGLKQESANLLERVFSL